MRIFEKLGEFRYEQVVFCHDKTTELKATIPIQTAPRASLGRLLDVTLRPRTRP